MDGAKTNSFGENFFNRNKRRLSWAISAGLLLAIAAIVCIELIKINSPTYVCTKPNNVNLIKEAALLIPGNMSEAKLETVADKIATINGSDRDVNCLYVLFKNAEYNKDFSEAQLYLNDFDKFYNPGKGISHYFDVYVDPSILKNELAFYKSALPSKSLINMSLRKE